jgi:hypothetical protein
MTTRVGRKTTAVHRGVEFIKRLISEEAPDNDGSVAVTDPETIGGFVSDPSFPFLVSFPRTGSHWLRMLMELYFERPLLTRTFYMRDRRDYLLLHTHDLGLDVEREDVIYLYRDPVDTVFSQLMYHGEKTGDARRIKRWADLYGRHLDKWLHNAAFVRHKTVIRYESLRCDPEREFEKVVAHFSAPLDEARLASALKEATRERVREKTTHDPRVVSSREGYGELRERFRAEHSALVWETLLVGRERLKDDF